jgi:hypothetical protein
LTIFFILVISINGLEFMWVFAFNPFLTFDID